MASFRILLLLALLSSMIEASQIYILSYQCEVKNAVVISESFFLSRSMTPLDNPIELSQLSLDTNKESSLEKILKQNRDTLLAFLMQEGVHSRSYESISSTHHASLITLTLPPTYIKVDFNDDYATITHLKTDTE